MIAVDTSALVAILEDEPDADLFAKALETDAAPLLSAGSFVELSIVMGKRRGPRGLALVDALIAEATIEIAPVTAAQARLAREASLRFGVLNFGDCFAYALARERGLPLLFKGSDFSSTDIESALGAA